MATSTSKSSVLSSQDTGNSSESQRSSLELRPCQRACRGVLLYWAPGPKPGSTSERSKEPVCLGLSASAVGPALDLVKVNAMREVPEGYSVDFQVNIGTTIYQTPRNTSDKVPPPGSEYGMEFLHFSRAPAAVETASSAPTSACVSPSAAAPRPASGSSSLPLPPFLASLASSAASAANNFTNSSEAYARLGKTWDSFNVAQYANKFQSQASKNVGHMTKWLQDLRNAVSKSKPTE